MFKPERLKICREKRGFSQSDLVFELAKTGFRVCRPTLDNWESGKTIPDADKIAILARFFEKPIEYFFGRINNKTGLVKETTVLTQKVSK